MAIYGDFLLSYGFGLERIGLWTLRWPKLTAALLITMILAAGATLPNLRFDQDINRVFLSQNKISQDYRHFVEDTGGQRHEIVLIAESPSRFTAVNYKQLHSFALDLEFLDGVSSVLSPFIFRFPDNALQHASQPVISVDLELAQIEQRIDQFSNLYKHQRSLISADRKAALFIINAEKGATPNAVERLINEVSTLADTASKTSLTMSLTGEDIISQEIVSALQSELITLNLFGSALVIFIALIIFRSVSLTIIGVTPALISVLMCLALFSLLNYPITVLSNVLPLLTLGLGIANSLHLISHWRSAPGENEHRIRDTLNAVGPGCALASVTTVISFMAIALTGNAQMFEFAVTGALSIAISYFAVISTFVLLAKTLGRSSPCRIGQEKKPALLSMLENGFQLHGTKVISISAVVFCVSFVGFSNATPWFSYEDNLPTDSEIRTINKRVSEKFGGFYRLWIEIDTSGQNSISTEKGWQRLAKIQEAIRSAAPNTLTTSIADIAGLLGIFGRLPTDEELSELPKGLATDYLSEQSDIARINAFISEPMQSHESLDIYDAIEVAALNAGAQKVVGLPVIMRHESISIVNQLRWGLLAACLASVAIIAFAFKSARLIPILLVPNILPMLIVDLSRINSASCSRLTRFSFKFDGRHSSYR